MAGLAWLEGPVLALVLDRGPRTLIHLVNPQGERGRFSLGMTEVVSVLLRAAYPAVFENCQDCRCACGAFGVARCDNPYPQQETSKTWLSFNVEPCSCMCSSTLSPAAACGMHCHLPVLRCNHEWQAVR